MKKYIIIATVCVIALIAFYTMYNIYLHNIDNKYANEYSRCLGSYDISQVDIFLDKDTIITCNGETNTYEKLRHNIISVFNDKKFSISKDSSYGSGNNRFVKGVQKVDIQSYVNFNDKNVEDYVEMEIEKGGFSSFRVKSINSDGYFFGYIFFGRQ